MMIFSFSLSGTKNRYTQGVNLNFEALNSILPNNHTVYIHIDNTVNIDIPSEWKIIHHDNNISNEHMFWRFETIDDILVNNQIVHVRDIDSIISSREIDILRTITDPVYCIRDHVWHNQMDNPVLGGLWGAKPSVFPYNFSYLVKWWIKNKKPFNYGDDMWFLNRFVYPYIYSYGSEYESHTSRWNGKKIPKCTDDNFIGKVFEK